MLMLVKIHHTGHAHACNEMFAQALLICCDMLMLVKMFVCVDLHVCFSYTPIFHHNSVTTIWICYAQLYHYIVLFCIIILHK